MGGRTEEDDASIKEGIMTQKRLLAISFLAGFVLWTAPSVRPSAFQPAELESLSFAKEGPAVAVSVHILGEFGNEAFTLREPDRLVIDVSPVEKISAAEQVEINAGGVLQVRTGRFQAAVARLVFDLDGPDVLYRIDRTPEGLKVTLWKEGEPALKADEMAPGAPVPQAQPEGGVPAAPQPAPVAALPQKPAEKPAERSAPAVPAEKAPERGYFALLGGGIGTFLSSESSFFRSFSVDGRQGTAESIYKPKLNTPAVLSFGKYVRLQEMNIKLGIDVEYWNFKSDGSHVFTVPHPFLADTDRTLEANNSFRSYFTAVSAFALVRVYAKEKLTVLVGPEIGFITGKYKFLDTIDIADAPPYTEAELSIRELTYKDLKASSLLAGLRVGFDYTLSSKLLLVLDLKMMYASPEIGELSNKIGLSQAGAVIGIQYNF
jgi:hypothetical protein